MKKIPVLLQLIIIVTCHSVSAEIITDGSVGKYVTLNSPDYQITQDLGKRVGDNLFHSFDSFSIFKGESATFSGDNDISNVISRVTGGTPSTIDGILRNTIPNSNTYFINPAGVLFGENAQLDVQGSFHVSTADYLRLQGGGRFDAREPSNSLLTIAPVVSFGFITDTDSTISMQNSTLSVLEEKTLSLIGGELELLGSPLTMNEENSGIRFESNIIAPSGRINLVSISSLGEVKFGQTHSIDIPHVPYGDIVANHTRIDTSGKGGGDIIIRGRDIALDHSIVAGNTLGEKKGGIIDIHAHHLTLNSAEISTNSYATGAAGSISITTTGDFIASGIGIYGFGNIVRSTSGNWEEFAASGLAVNSNAGNAGIIRVDVGQQMSFSEGAYLDTSTYGAGKGGLIEVKADSLTLFGMSSYDYPTGFYSVAEAGQTGEAGSIQVNARQLNILAGSAINTATAGKGNAGSIIVNVADTLTLLGKGTNGEGSSIYSSEFNYDDLPEASGNAGRVIIHAGNIHLIDSGEITTYAVNASGGDIVITVNQLLSLQKGLIMTSVKGGKGNGGNITIKYPQFVVLNQGQIKAQADEGHGGNIHIIADKFIDSTDSLISASSNLGLDGSVEIDSPDIEIDGSLIALSADLLDASDQLQPLCNTQLAKNKSSFIVKKLAGNAPSPDDWKSTVLILLPENEKGNVDLKEKLSAININMKKNAKIGCSRSFILMSKVSTSDSNNSMNIKGESY